MQLLITHGRLARTRVLQLHPWQMLAALAALAVTLMATSGLMLAALAALAVTLMATSGLIYHFVFLKAAREGWPLVSPVISPIVRNELAARDRYMRDNLDAIALKVGEMQARMLRLEAMGERVAGLAGVKPDELKLPPGKTAPAPMAGGRGGPFVPIDSPSVAQLKRLVEQLDESSDFHTDILTLAESRLLEGRLRARMIPSAPPLDVAVGSGFGFRRDPFNGRAALHTGLDFPAEAGTPIQAAADGIVAASQWHPEYGHVLEIGHGNGLSTRYAHCASIEVQQGALVRRGQIVARVGTSGRSTGAHLHFEVLVEGVPHDPARFLADAAAPAVAARTAAGRR